jgi:hypothetical protein
MRKSPGGQAATGCCTRADLERLLDLNRSVDADRSREPRTQSACKKSVRLRRIGTRRIANATQMRSQQIIQHDLNRSVDATSGHVS